MKRSIRKILALSVTIAVPLVMTSAWGVAPFITSDGSRLNMPERGFSLTPPTEWEYRTDLPGLSLFMQAQKEKGVRYQRNIQVMVRSTPLSIDEATAKQIEEELTKVFGKGGVNVSNFHVRNHEIVQLTNGAKGILYYTGMKLDDMDLMQIHVVTSSDKRHYISTFTDVAEHFDKGTDSPMMMTAWESLSSIQLDGEAPSRFQMPIYIFGGLGLLILAALAFTTIRTVNAAMRYKAAVKSTPSRRPKEKNGEEAWHVSKTPQSVPKSRPPSQDGLGFSGNEVTKASAHARPLAKSSENSEDDWNFDNDKGQAG